MKVESLWLTVGCSHPAWFLRGPPHIFAFILGCSFTSCLTFLYPKSSTFCFFCDCAFGFVGLNDASTMNTLEPVFWCTHVQISVENIPGNEIVGSWVNSQSMCSTLLELPIFQSGYCNLHSSQQYIRVLNLLACQKLEIISHSGGFVGVSHCGFNLHLSAV